MVPSSSAPMMVVGTRPAMTPRYSPLVVLGSPGYAGVLLRRRVRSHRYVGPACLAGGRPAPYKSASEFDAPFVPGRTLDERKDTQPCHVCGGRFRGAGSGASFLFHVRRGKDRDPERHGEGAGMDQPAQLAARHGRGPDDASAPAMVDRACLDGPADP